MPRPRLPRILLLHPIHNLVILLTTTALILQYLNRPPFCVTSHPPKINKNLSSGSQLPSLHDDLSLSSIQCRQAFPGLFQQIDDQLKKEKIKLEWREGVITQAKIEGNRLYILRTPRKGDLSSSMHHRHLSTLSQIHRALLTSPDLLSSTPILLSLSIHDTPPPSTLSYASPLFNPSHKRFLPIPHFSYWSWPPFPGSISQASHLITTLEGNLTFQEKDARAVWRGTSWFNNGGGMNPHGRQDLLKVAKFKEWADVEALEWTSNDGNAENAIPISEFCRYKYIINTEGIGYAGRLQFHQLCNSVILSPPLEYMQHTSHLIKPVFSTTLLGTPAKERDGFIRARKVWQDFGAGEANMVFVRPDWSDLENVVAFLENHQCLAEGIANRQRETFHGKGYISPAAEVCYWREALKGWAEMTVPIGEGWNHPGVPFEDFITRGQDDREVIVSGTPPKE